LRPILKNYMLFLGPGPMKDVYLDFRLPWPAKIAAGMLTPGKWRPFEIYLTTTRTSLNFDHTYISAFPVSNRMGYSIKMIIAYTKRKGKILHLLACPIILRICQIESIELNVFSR
jgi:hypothetical protein